MEADEQYNKLVHACCKREKEADDKQSDERAKDSENCPTENSSKETVEGINGVSSENHESAARHPGYGNESTMVFNSKQPFATIAHLGAIKADPGGTDDYESSANPTALNLVIHGMGDTKGSPEPLDNSHRMHVKTVDGDAHEMEKDKVDPKDMILSIVEYETLARMMSSFVARQPDSAEIGFTYTTLCLQCRLVFPC